MCSQSGNALYNIESENFILCNPRKKSIQHFNIDFTFPKCSIRQSTPEFHCDSVLLLTLPSHSFEGQPQLPLPGAQNPEIGRNDFPVESLRLMNETLTTHRFSRNGPVNRAVSAALSRMDMGKDVTTVWQRLDEYVTTDSQTECHKIEMDAGAIANRLHDAQVGLAEAVYRREWNDEWAPILSLLIPGTWSGEDCRDADLSTPMSTRMAQCQA